MYMYTVDRTQYSRDPGRLALDRKYNTYLRDCMYNFPENLPLLYAITVHTKKSSILLIFFFFYLLQWVTQDGLEATYVEDTDARAMEQ